jgi:hypothetical protein
VQFFFFFFFLLLFFFFFFFLLFICFCFFFFFFFYWDPVASAPGSTAAMKAYCTSPALEVPVFTAMSPNAYDERDL